jgi:hypothetical protein
MPVPVNDGRQAAARAANRAGTRRTTRPGSEATTLTAGAAVRVNRAETSSGTWPAYDGRDGWVATVHRQEFPNGNTYVELGVTWTRPTPRRHPAADAWFRADEIVPR